MKINIHLAKYTIKILLLIVLFSCSKDDESSFNGDCKVTATNGVRVYSPSYDIVYLAEYFYDSNNKLISRDLYERASFVGTEARETSYITYDSNNRIIEISTYLRVLSSYAVDVYEYNGSNLKPSKINQYREEIDGTRLLTYEEDLIYNNLEQLEKVIRTYISSDRRVEIDYKYNFDGNLIEKKDVLFRTKNNLKDIVIETFSNYDNYRNPFKNLPFSSLRGFSESNNNYLSYSKRYTLYSQSNPEGNLIESIDYSTDPSNLSYLELSKYQCEE